MVLNYKIIKETKFIFISSVKCHKVKDRKKAYYWANRILTQVKENVPLDINALIEAFSDIVEQPYDAYGVSKLVAEYIVRIICCNYFILRCDYIIGIENEDNQISTLFEDLFNRNTLILPNKKRGFISYRDLSNIVNAILDSEIAMHSDRTFNLFGIYQYSANDLIKKLDIYIKILNSKRKIELVERGYELVGNKDLNEDTTSLYRDVYKRDYSYVNIEDEITNLFYRSYIRNVLHYTIVEELCGGSYAKVYKVCTDEEMYSLKMALGEGADNGSKKIFDEVRQLYAIQDCYKNKQISSKMYPAKIIKFGSNLSFSYVVSEWKDGEVLFEKILNGENCKKYIDEIIGEITKSYLIKQIQCDKDIWEING